MNPITTAFAVAARVFVDRGDLRQLRLNAPGHATVQSALAAMRPGAQAAD